MVSACSTGVGPDAFTQLHKSARSPKEILQQLRGAKSTGVQWQNQILARTQIRNDIFLVSNLEDDVVKDMMMIPVRTIEEGLEEAFKVLGKLQATTSQLSKADSAFTPHLLSQPT